jgi:hypothetical protein
LRDHTVDVKNNVEPLQEGRLARWGWDTRKTFLAKAAHEKVRILLLPPFGSAKRKPCQPLRLRLLFLEARLDEEELSKCEIRVKFEISISLVVQKSILFLSPNLPPSFPSLPSQPSQQQHRRPLPFSVTSNQCRLQTAELCLQDEVKLVLVRRINPSRFIGEPPSFPFSSLEEPADQNRYI